MSPTWFLLRQWKKKEQTLQWQRSQLAPRPTKQHENSYKPINLPGHLKPCDVILKQLSKLENIWVFNEPVNLSNFTFCLKFVQIFHDFLMFRLRTCF